MKQILQQNKWFYEMHSGATHEKKHDVMVQNILWPEGLLQKWCSAASFPLQIAPLFATGHSLHSAISATQRFHAVGANRA